MPLNAAGHFQRVPFQAGHPDTATTKNQLPSGHCREASPHCVLFTHGPCLAIAPTLQPAPTHSIQGTAHRAQHTTVPHHAGVPLLRGRGRPDAAQCAVATARWGRPGCRGIRVPAAVGCVARARARRRVRGRRRQLHDRVHGRVPPAATQPHAAVLPERRRPGGAAAPAGRSGSAGAAEAAGARFSRRKHGFPRCPPHPPPSLLRLCACQIRARRLV